MKGNWTCCTGQEYTKSIRHLIKKTAKLLGWDWNQSTVCIWQGRKAIQDRQWSYHLERSLTLFQRSAKTSSRKPSMLKASFGPFGIFLTPSLRLFLTSIIVSSYLGTCWVQNIKFILFYKSLNISFKDFQRNCWCNHHHVLSMTHDQAAPSMGNCRCLEAQWGSCEYIFKRWLV